MEDSPHDAMRRLDTHVMTRFAIATLMPLLFAATLPLSALAQTPEDLASPPGVETLNSVENDAQSVGASRAAGGQGNIQAKNTVARPTDCTASITNIGAFFNFICWGRTIGAVIDGVLVGISSWLLTVAGILFNWLVTNTVIQFGTVYAGIKDAVETAWTAFRDIANILIIGIFTFIAVSIILGLKEFGQKKLIARVLIIAILINFSLLFSKMVVDASNFVALQLYTAATGQGISSNTGISQLSLTGCPPGTSNAQCYGISGAFMDYMGVSGFRDTRQAVSNLADSIDDGVTAFIHGFFAALILLGAAFVLFYGSFLLASRIILIIFLFVTAAAAFASYLIPAWETSSYGWKVWWNSLLKVAAFAPILILFLWVTLTVGEAMKSSGGTLGDLIANPTKGADIQSLFNYFVILGLLFISFKLSSTFAGKIAGFSFASLAPALGFGIGARLAAFAGRQTVGRAGMFVGNRLADRAAKAPAGSRMGKLYDFGAQRFKGLGRQEFNVARTRLGSAIQETAGIKKLDTIAGKQIKGFEGSQKALAEKIADQAKRLTPDATQQAAVTKAAIQKEFARDPDMARDYRSATEAAGQFEKLQKQEQNTLATLHDQHADEMRALYSTVEKARSAAAAGTGSAAAVARAEQDIVDAKQRQATAIDAQTQRIKDAQTRMNIARGSAEETVRLAEKRARDTGRFPTFRNTKEIAADLARNRFTSALFTKEENEQLARMASKEVGTKSQKQRLKESGLIDLLKEETGDGHGGSTPPTPPAAGGAGGPHHP